MAKEECLVVTKEECLVVAKEEGHQGLIVGKEECHQCLTMTNQKAHQCLVMGKEVPVEKVFEVIVGDLLIRDVYSQRVC